MDTILCQGAEATLIKKDDKLLKSRIAKTYRIPQIDDSLRLSRTRKEMKALKKANELEIPVPALYESPNKYTLTMDFIDGQRLRDVAQSTDAIVLSYFKEVGVHVATLHKHQLIHGDLTTSNILIGDTLYLIDFGLSFFSGKIEDMAVDIHVLEEALESTHHVHAQTYFASFLEGYTLHPQYDDVIERLEVVRSRGKNKHRGTP